MPGYSMNSVFCIDAGTSVEQVAIIKLTPACSAKFRYPPSLINIRSTNTLLLIMTWSKFFAHNMNSAYSRKQSFTQLIQHIR
jgi:hypothetical protein